MSDPVVPSWVDDLFPFPTPAAFRPVVDLAWEHATREGYYDPCDFGTHPALFDLAVVASPPAGWECSPEFPEAGGRQPTVVFYATPEFVPFGARGDGGYFGWLVPAPELHRSDHPVGCADGHQPGLVVQLGPDTRTGLELLMSSRLRHYRDDPHSLAPTHPDLADRSRAQLRRLAGLIGAHPDPNRGAWPDARPAFPVPAGWRHESGSAAIGVLAPADAFADRAPAAAVSYDFAALAPVLADAARLLAAGCPASALLCVENAFADLPTCCFVELKPLWTQAYRDLGRDGYVPILDAMLPVYRDVPCFCDTHRTAGPDVESTNASRAPD